MLLKRNSEICASCEDREDWSDANLEGNEYRKFFRKEVGKGKSGRLENCNRTNVRTKNQAVGEDDVLDLE